MSERLGIIGAGASGVFAAICAAEASPDALVEILEKSSTPLQKVKVSGGGRCNVTHACFDPYEFIDYYPRGGKELLGPFHHFGAGDVMEWFEDRGVNLKVEDDHRVFPESNQSSTIIECLLEFAERAGVVIQLSHGVKSVRQEGDVFHVVLDDGSERTYDRLLMAPGSQKRLWDQVGKLGHYIVPPVPSLFTFQIRDARIRNLAGISLSRARITIPLAGLETEGPLLITHVGLSGPAVLKLSSFGARWMYDHEHFFNIYVDWVPNFTHEELLDELNQCRKRVEFQRKRISSNAMFGLPLRLWKSFCDHAKIPETANWSDVSKPVLRRLAATLSESEFQVVGKNTFKEEFVTAGGVSLDEVDFKTMESRVVPGLYLAGEFLNIDAVTGGFNFQAAWTTGWIAGHAMAGAPI